MGFNMGMPGYTAGPVLMYAPAYTRPYYKKRYRRRRKRSRKSSGIKPSTLAMIAGIGMLLVFLGNPAAKAKIGLGA